MDIVIITTCIIAAILLLLAELFLIPGISIAGVLSVGCLGYANYYAFSHLGEVAGFITLITSLLACTTSLIAFMRSKTLDKLALQKNITSKIDNSSERQINVGDCGISTTRLALIGYAEINGHFVEVKSTDGLLSERTPIRVCRITDGIILVERNK